MLSTRAHVHTLIQGALRSLIQKAPMIFDQNSHSQLQVPRERKVIGHLGSGAPPDPTLCCPEWIQFCWQEEGAQPWGNQQFVWIITHFACSPAESFIFQKFKVETKGDAAAECFTLLGRSMNSPPQRSAGQDVLAHQVR